MFFMASKIFWALAQPLNALCLLALIGLAVRAVWPKEGQGIMNFALILILFFGIVPIGPLALTWLERQYPAPPALPEKIDGVIVLGGGFESYLTQTSGHIVANDSVDRVFCFVEIAKKHPKARLVFSGGPGDILHPDAMESLDARLFFHLSGLDGTKILYETQSRNTYENAYYTREMVKPKAGENWVLVTSAFHMPRSVGSFEKLGWKIIPYQCDPRTDGAYNIGGRLPNVTGNFSAMNIAFKEIIGLIVYNLTGKSAFIIPPGSVASTS